MSINFTLDPVLRDYGTPMQQEHFDTLMAHGGATMAAAATGVPVTTYQSALRNMRHRAASKGYSPDNHLNNPVPDNFTLKKYSLYIDKEGKPGQRWLKADLDDEKRLEMIRVAIESLTNHVPAFPAVAAPKNPRNADLLNLYTLTDCHVGMLAWNKESGKDWDVHIATHVLTKCFRDMVDRSPPAETCIINQLGDFMHYDSFEAVTPAHKNLLDADGRFHKMIDSAIHIMLDVINYALLNHKNVHVICAEGNHDPAGAGWLARLIKHSYANNPRLTVDTTPKPFYVYQFGKVMLCFHHGHKVRMASLPGLFACDYPLMWGSTQYRYGHMGHRHHVEEKAKGLTGMKVMQHATLAPNDAYAARGGWRADQEVVALTYHKDFGEHSSIHTTPQMLGLMVNA